MSDKEYELAILPDGTVKFIYYEPLKPLLTGKYSIKRVSHVVPVGKFRRRVFMLLRDTFGENGRVANWTRRWRGPWVADLSPVKGPTLGPFEARDEAIAAEVQWICDHVSVLEE